MEPINTPTELFDPTYVNMEFVFAKFASFLEPIFKFITDPKTWEYIGYVSVLISILAITIIVFSLVRAFEIQQADKEEIENEINLALARKKEQNRVLNPKWKYIETLIESPNESDWRVAILEADTLLEHTFKDRGLVGNTMAELLEEAKSNGYPNMENAWDAHIVRNKIAHEGQNFKISQVEARRVIKLFQIIFEDLRVI